MFEGLINFDPETGPPAGVTAVEDAQPGEIVRAQAATADWLEEIGAISPETVDAALGRKQARETFGALTTANVPIEQQKAQLLAIKAPEAVRHLTSMLTAYDWEFVEQAKQIRGFVVAKLLEDANNPNATVRQKALAMLGKVTEVGLFTDKVEIKKTDLSDAELDARIKEKLNRFQQVVTIEDARMVVDEDPAGATTAPDAAHDAQPD